MNPIHLPPPVASNISRVSDIVGRTSGSDFDMEVHHQIYSILLGHLKNLHDNKYVGTQGVCCSTLVGAKGIGKTACLKTFTMLGKFALYHATMCAATIQCCAMNHWHES